MKIYQQILNNKNAGKKQLAVLVDPDKTQGDDLKRLGELAMNAGVDYFFAGGSLLTTGNITDCVTGLKNACDIPVVIFPGSVQQVTPEADAVLFLSLISGRNPDLLIGHQVTAAPIIKQFKLESISTGYILIESGNHTAVQYISNTIPIPADRNDIAAYTALAGEMLGMKLIFAEAGSGALNPVSEAMIEKIRSEISIPLITGGGIRTPEKAIANCKAGADLIVVGNSIEKDKNLIQRMADAVHGI
ncbi:MAG: geranylgeranylglyceryl/heptaprenylglyceryl phosphate synthase [Bacteroidota bacterium]